MKRAAVITNYNIADKAATAVAAIRAFVKCGVEAAVPEYALKTACGARLREIGDVFPVPFEKLYDGADIAVVIGGDGSILEAVRHIGARAIPVLGINKGRIGYMADLEAFELDKIKDVCEGRYRVEERAMIRVDIVNEGRVTYTSYALNDAYITNGSVSRMIDLSLTVNGDYAGKYRSDGVIVATPTGSTAYSLSAGGPILDPAMKCMCITPICAHSLSSRPMVFPADAVIDIKNICDREPNTILTIDGKENRVIKKGDYVRVTMNDRSTGLVRVKPGHFYSDFQKKLENK